MFADFGPWRVVKDGDERAFSLFSRHYSYKPYRDNRRQIGYKNRFLICGPGEKMVLLSADEAALFVWRKFNNPDEVGVNCSVFRNESSNFLSSFLIREAVELARLKWPLETRFYTYVNPRLVASGLPGYCFRRAGWCDTHRVTKWNDLLIFEKLVR